MPSDTKTYERKEGAAAAVQAKHGDNYSANQVDPDPMCLASFGEDSSGPPALPCLRDDALVDNGAAALKSCLSPLGMRTPIAAGVLLPADTASTATRTTFDQPPLWFCPTEEMNLKTSDQYAIDYGSFWKMKVLQTKSIQTLIFDPGGFKGNLRACLFWGTWRALLCREVRFGAAGGDLERFSYKRRSSEYHYLERGTSNSYVLRSVAVFSAARLA